MAPIIIFAYNRPDSLMATIEALACNEVAKSSDLFIFVDGFNDQSKNKVLETRKIAQSAKGFKSVTCEFSEKNKGLGPSIIYGVSKVINEFGQAIIVEDDLIVLPNFLNFMNQGLNLYKSDKNVFSICGYSNDISIDENYPYDAYACVRSSSWGWATWKDRWESVDWNLEDWLTVEATKKDFNKWGGSDCFGMLEGWKHGKNKSWAIRFCYSQFLNKSVSIFPNKSLVINNGFDGNGTNCKKWSRFKFQLMDKDMHTFRFPSNTQINRKYLKQALSYHSLSLRIISKLAYIIYR